MVILDKRRLAGNHSYSFSIAETEERPKKRYSDQVTHNFQTFFGPIQTRGDGGIGEGTRTDYIGV